VIRLSTRKPKPKGEWKSKVTKKQDTKPKVQDTKPEVPPKPEAAKAKPPPAEKVTKHLAAGAKEFVFRLTEYLSKQKMQLSDLFKQKDFNLSRDGEEIHGLAGWQIRGMPGTKQNER
jgi:hypothetical protein